MADIQFEFPSASFLFLFCPFFVLMFFYLYYFREQTLRKYAESQLLHFQLVPRSTIEKFFKLICFPLIWFFSTLALLSPQGNIRYEEAVKTDTASYVASLKFLVDTSASMGVVDYTGKKSRLELAKLLMENILSKLPPIQLSLDAFTSVLTPIVPQTFDHLFVRLMIRDLEINEGGKGGTDFQIVIEELLNSLKKEERLTLPIILLFSDGEEDVEITSSQTSKNLQTLFKDGPKNLSIYTIGIGEENPSLVPGVKNTAGQEVRSKLNPAILKQIASDTQSKYFSLSNQMISDLSAEIVKNVVEKIENNQQLIKQKTSDHLEKLADLYYQFPLAVAIILLFGGLLVDKM